MNGEHEHDEIFDHLPLLRIPVLSLRQMNRLLAPDWNDPNSGVIINKHPSQHDVASSPFLADCRIMLQAALDAGGVKATTAGNLNRKLVFSLLDQLSWPVGEWETRVTMFPVRNEEDAILLHLVRDIVEIAGLMLRRKGYFRVTKMGERLLAEERAGELFALLLGTFFRKFNLAYLDGYDTDIFQATVGFSLWGLSQVDREWYSVEELWPLLVHPAARSYTGWSGVDAESQPVLESRLLRPLVLSGLLDRRTIARKSDTPGVEWYRKTELFDAVFSFDPGPP